ncbi:glucose-6-phosphate isomerase [Thiovibrio frasassiensis]|uniref:Glucose-6-phosphate isomerase n=1 Tax=Thiovibrio frasassiensis TaxID=2984131 RepID=A0A9X4MCN0_9BACT|nr:glucose-6-phosphate isomerase [Thiovibrio frasassiensis]MDG4475109.1 glucose-6-phosphate isomerase [Thiovibrio frasassiensis]
MEQSAESGKQHDASLYFSRDFNKMASFAELGALARAPYDLTAPDALSPARIRRYRTHAAGFDLLYSTQRVDEPVLAALQKLAEESGAVAQFRLMKKGAVLNRIEGYASEERQVLHTACRDIFAPGSQAPEATEQAKGELVKLADFLTALEAGSIVNAAGEVFTDLIQVGIGGSDLGPRALYLALAAYKFPGRRVHFISNVDPDDAAATLSGLDLSRTLVNVVSKSGSTLETMTNEALVRKAFSEAGLEPERHFLAVTGKGSPMDNPARYLRSFYMFDSIGGRYSATSMVGAVMLGFALGYPQLLEILRGAQAMDLAAEEEDILCNPPLLLALLGIWNHSFLGSETLAILPYSQALVRFTAHLQQCDMESNGKSVTRQGKPLAWKSGPIIWGEPGTNGQHAFYQLIHQGTAIVPVEFIGFRTSQHGSDLMIEQTTSQEKLVANLLAQALALATGQPEDNPNRRFPGNRPSSLLLADRLTPYTMGALLALYEAKVVFQGFIWNINSFDQEGVQLGKRLATRLLAHYAGRRQDPGYSGEESDALGWALLGAAGMLSPERG